MPGDFRTSGRPYLGRHPQDSRYRDSRLTDSKSRKGGLQRTSTEGGSKASKKWHEGLSAAALSQMKLGPGRTKVHATTTGVTQPGNQGKVKKAQHKVPQSGALRAKPWWTNVPAKELEEMLSTDKEQHAESVVFQPKLAAPQKPEDPYAAERRAHEEKRKAAWKNKGRSWNA